MGTALVVTDALAFVMLFSAFAMLLYLTFNYKGPVSLTNMSKYTANEYIYLFAQHSNYEPLGCFLLPRE